jgi:hypothetical protein
VGTEGEGGLRRVSFSLLLLLLLVVSFVFFTSRDPSIYLNLHRRLLLQLRFASPRLAFWSILTLPLPLTVRSPSCHH